MPLVGVRRAGQQPDRRRLARARRADEPEDRCRPGRSARCRRPRAGRRTGRRAVDHDRVGRAGRTAGRRAAIAGMGRHRSRGVSRRVGALGRRPGPGCARAVALRPRGSAPLSQRHRSLQRRCDAAGPIGRVRRASDRPYRSTMAARSTARPGRVRTDAPPRARPGSATRPTTGPGSPAGEPAAGSAYRDADGAAIRDARGPAPGSAALAIPPAWTDVWICPDPNGHLQATGRDARGRKQYRYHARWRAGRDDAKFERLIDVRQASCRAIRDALRRRPRPTRAAAREGAGGGRPAARADAHPGRQRRVRAAQPLVRPDDAARTATRAVDGTAVRFRFRGKSGQQHEVGIRDRRLAAVVRRCQDLPGPGAVPVRRRRRRRRTTSPRTTSTPTCARSPARTSRPRTSGRGPGPCSRTARCRRSAPGERGDDPRRNVVEAMRTTADRSATRRPWRDAATSTRRSSRPIWTARSAARCSRRWTTAVAPPSPRRPRRRRSSSCSGIGWPRMPVARRPSRPRRHKKTPPG